MAKITGPLFSNAAAGSIGQAIIFQNFHGLPTARHYFKPKNTMDVGREVQRARYGLLIPFWNEIKKYPVDVKAWEDRGKLLGVKGTGYNAFMSAYLKDWIDGAPFFFTKNTVINHLYLTLNPYQSESKYLAHIWVTMYIKTGLEPATFYASIGTSYRGRSQTVGPFSGVSTEWILFDLGPVVIPWNYTFGYIDVYTLSETPCNGHIGLAYRENVEIKTQDFYTEKVGKKTSSLILKF